MNKPNDQLDHDDSVLRDRLRGLAAQSPDTRELEARLEAAIASESSQGSPTYRFPLRRSIFVGVAALLAIGVSVGLLMPSRVQGREISVEELIAVHDEAIANRDEKLIPVSTVDEANRALAGQWPSAPRLPGVEAGEPFACCVHHFGNDRAVCLHMDYEGARVTVMTANLDTIRPPSSGTRVAQGVMRWSVHEVGDYSVLCGDVADRCVCVVGKTTREQLLALAETFDFQKP